MLRVAESVLGLPVALLSDVVDGSDEPEAERDPGEAGDTEDASGEVLGGAVFHVPEAPSTWVRRLLLRIHPGTSPSTAPAGSCAGRPRPQAHGGPGEQHLGAVSIAGGLVMMGRLPSIATSTVPSRNGRIRPCR